MKNSALRIERSSIAGRCIALTISQTGSLGLAGLAFARDCFARRVRDIIPPESESATELTWHGKYASVKKKRGTKKAGTRAAGDRPGPARVLAPAGRDDQRRRRLGRAAIRHADAL